MNKENLNASETTLIELIKVVSELRDPSTGCPWDLKQTNLTLIPYILEEAYEVVDSIRHGNDENLKEELGDLLFQVILHSQIANEKNSFSFTDVISDIHSKLIRRHPHVFEKQRSISHDELSKQWELIKQSEKPSCKNKSPLTHKLERKIRSQPALYGAITISRKVEQAGLKWESIDNIWDKVNEEMNELKLAIKNKDFANAEEELGDVIFTLINIANCCNLDPEESLARTNKKFLERFSYIESSLNGDFSRTSLQNFRRLWQEAKEKLSKQKASKPKRHNAQN